MRTDVRIGIAVGLLLAIIAIVYFIIVDGTGTDQQQVDDPSADPAQSSVRVIDDPADSTVPDTTVVPDQPQPEPEPLHDQIVIPSLDDVPADEVPGTITIPPSGVTPIADVRIAPVTLPPALAADPLAPIEIPASPAESFRSNVERTYVVQHGDNGFWTVSQRMYGHGKYFGVIAKANPDIDSASLRPGQKLRVPPLAQKHRRTSVGPDPVIDPAGGERIYTVRKGDEGFWGVSAAVYGHGKYYRHIARANPGINSDNLKAGQKLRIPPKPTSTADAPAVGAANLPQGYRVYIVRRGDAGFWDVAVNMYGNGRYFGLLVKANPGVDSRRLQPGQKLIVPPLSHRRPISTSEYVIDTPVTPAGEPQPAPARRRTEPDRADPRPSFD